jgi:hypothetical protein
MGYPDPSFMPPLSLAMPLGAQYAPQGMYQQPMVNPVYSQSPTAENSLAYPPPPMSYQQQYTNPESYENSPAPPGSEFDAVIGGMRGLDLESETSKPEKGEKRRSRLSTLIDRFRGRTGSTDSGIPAPRPGVLKTNSFPL